MKDFKLSLRLAVLSIRKKKENFIELGVLAMLSVMFLVLGLSVNSRANIIFQEKTEELHSAHLLIPCTATTFKSEYEDYIYEYSNPEELEKENVAFLPTATNSSNQLELGALFFNMDAKRDIAPIHIIEEDTSISSVDAIYVPIQLKSEGVEMGKPYTLSYKGRDYTFMVAGYFETTTFCNINSGFYKYFIHDEMFEHISKEAGSVTMLSVRYAGNAKDIMQMTDEFRDQFLAETTYSEDQNSFLLNVLSYQMMQARTVTFLFIGVAILFMVSLLITAVTLFILVNNIREDIEKSTGDIGTLEAIGYTIRQIKNAFVLQYLLVVLMGGVIGAGMSYLCNFVLAGFLMGMSGLAWKGFPHIGQDVTANLIMAVIITFISTICVKKMKKITPVAALTGRNDTNVKTKAVLPMQKGNLSLNLHIAVKNLMIYAKSNLVFSMIVGISAFAVGLTLIIFLNFAVNTDVLVRTIGYELSDARIIVSTGCDAVEFADTLEKEVFIRKTNPVGNGELLRYENETVTTFIPSDYDKLEYISPYEGEFPKLKNEVMISSMLSAETGIKKGDSITFTVNDMPKEYLVSGIFSSTNGYVAYMTEDGIRQYYPDYTPNCIDIYLREGITTDDFAQYLKENYSVSVDNDSESVAEQKIAALLADYGVSSVSYSIWQDGKEICSGNSSRFNVEDVTYMKKFANSQVGIYSKYMSAVVIGIFITMIFVVASVLRMTLREEILRCRNEFGILKALGYTSKDIVKQISLRFLISSVSGSLVGSVIAMLGSPVLFRYIFSIMGVTQVQVNAHPLELMLYCVLLCIILYGVTLVTGRSVKKISVYDLLAE